MNTNEWEAFVLKSDVKRKDLTSNLLNKVTLRIDFLRIVNIEELVADLQKLLIDKNFFLTNEDFINDIELQINDPDVLSEDGFKVKKSIKRERIYIFQNPEDTIDLIVGESCIIFNVKKCNEKYCFASCIETFCNVIILAQEKFKFIRFTRIGLRKINNIICKDTNLYYCFEKDFFNEINIKDSTKNDNEIKYMRRQSIDNCEFNGHSFNILKFIQEGFLDDQERAFNVVLDIDGYIKENICERFDSYNDLETMIKKINDDIFEIFKSMITEHLINDLISGKSDKVEWGLNKND